MFRADVVAKTTAQGNAAREAASAWRHLGAIAFSKDPKEARTALAKACELDPRRDRQSFAENPTSGGSLGQ
ncbi:MAG: hypothetical protein CTY20_10735 [Hyphomicrobium sp.]|nr:MAG: hypothetical protein CTY20_10735 [Hyphomicrobium sp.]